MSDWATLFLLPLSGALAVGGLSFVVYYVLAAEESPFRGIFAAYEARLENHTRFLLVDYSGAQIARLQIILCSVLIALTLVAESFWLGCVVCTIAGLPPYLLWKRHQARVARLEEQLDGWLMLLSNALKATSSIGEAMESTVYLVAEPFRSEIDLVVKEHKLGTPVDRAVKQMAARIDSPIVAGALATIVVGRHTGGDLSTILKTAGDTLREAARLEGVFRTKTSEAKGQLIVLGVFPFALAAALDYIAPFFFEPLFKSQLGMFIVLAGFAAYVGALLWAREILKFDV